jgi:hypothetical protein
MVVVVVATAVVAAGVVAVVAVTAVVTAVGVPVGTDSTATCEILTVYTRSITARFDVSVAGPSRYPYDPPAFL